MIVSCTSEAEHTFANLLKVSCCLCFDKPFPVKISFKVSLERCQLNICSVGHNMTKWNYWDCARANARKPTVNGSGPDHVQITTTDCLVSSGFAITHRPETGSNSLAGFPGPL